MLQIKVRVFRVIDRQDRGNYRPDTPEGRDYDPVIDKFGYLSPEWSERLPLSYNNDNQIIWVSEYTHESNSILFKTGFSIPDIMEMETYTKRNDNVGIANGEYKFPDDNKESEEFEDALYERFKKRLRDDLSVNGQPIRVKCADDNQSEDSVDGRPDLGC